MMTDPDSDSEEYVPCSDHGSSSSIKSNEEAEDAIYEVPCDITVANFWQQRSSLIKKRYPTEPLQNDELLRKMHDNNTRLKTLIDSKIDKIKPDKVVEAERPP